MASSEDLLLSIFTPPPAEEPPHSVRPCNLAPEQANHRLVVFQAATAPLIHQVPMRHHMGKPQAMLQVPKAWQASASSGGMQRPGTAQAAISSPGFPPSPGFPEASPAKATQQSPAVASGFPPSPGFPEASPAKASASSGGMQWPRTAQDENLVLTEALKKSEAEKEMWRRKADELEALLLSGRDRQEAPDQESLQMIEEEGCETYFLRKQLKELWVMQKTMLEKQEVMAQQLERRGQDGNTWHILLRKSPSTTTSQHRPHTGCRELHGKLYRGSNEHQKVRSTNEDEVILGGYAAWQEVVASRDIQVGERVMIACGTSGIVLCNHETTHIKVKFDASLHGTGTVNVFVEDLMSQLPRNPLGLKIGDAVVAAMNLETGPVVAVPFGTYGTVLGAGQEGRIQVRFNASDKEPAKCLSVQSFELQPAKELVGGFRVAQRVKASVDIRAEETVLVQLGTYGTVLGEYSDTRLVVRFDQRMDGLEQAVNLGPGEIEAA